MFLTWPFLICVIFQLQYKVWFHWEKIFIRNYHGTSCFDIFLMYPSLTFQGIPCHCINTMFLNTVVFICGSTHMTFIIWQLYAILPCEMLQRMNTLIKYLREYSSFKCAYLAIWAVKKDRKWILKDKLSGKFPLDIGFYILWEQVLCLIHLWIFRAESVPGTEQTFNKCL